MWGGARYNDTPRESEDAVSPLLANFERMVYQSPKALPPMRNFMVGSGRGVAVDKSKNKEVARSGNRSLSRRDVRYTVAQDIDMVP